MLFNSFEFCIFFPIVFALYWVSSRRIQNLLLLAASYIFYSFWDWRFLSLILISTIVDYYSGIQIDKYRDSVNAKDLVKKKRWVTVSIVCNLGLLGFFKYYNFFIESAEVMLSVTGIDVSSLRLNLILPMGISFYTFQTMSYTIDIYRGKMRPTRNFLDFALYVAFFPQLVAGPIERAVNLLPRISSKRVFSGAQLVDGLQLMTIGFFKKVYVADNLAVFTDQIYAMPSPGAWEVLAGFWTFGVQIYCDFSGYSDIARGCAKCLGLELMLNFNYPYISKNMSEFWNRWHISLSSWLRDYLYFPLGGSRHGEYKTYRNLAITMLLSGLWHGSTWNTVIWGGYMALILVAHRVSKPYMDTLTFHKKIIPTWFRDMFRIFLTFSAFTFGFILFRSITIEQAGIMFANFFNGQPTVDHTAVEMIVPFLKFGLPLFVFEYVLHQLKKESVRRMVVQPEALECILYSVLFYLVVFYGATAQSFIYFQF